MSSVCFHALGRSRAQHAPLSLPGACRREQMRTLGTWGVTSFGFALFKWFFSATGDACGGFNGFPTLGLKALKWTWSYDFSLTYIGVGALRCAACLGRERSSRLPGSMRVMWGQGRVSMLGVERTEEASWEPCSTGAVLHLPAAVVLARQQQLGCVTEAVRYVIGSLKRPLR